MKERLEKRGGRILEREEGGKKERITVKPWEEGALGGGRISFRSREGAKPPAVAVVLPRTAFCQLSPLVWDTFG